MTDPVVLLLTGVEAERSTTPEAVPVKSLAPETQEAARGAPELTEAAVEEPPRQLEESATTCCQNRLWK
jgi:hypothetical protein